MKKLFKFDRAVAVFVENVENEAKNGFKQNFKNNNLRSKSTWIAMGKELIVDFGEFVFGQLAGRTIFEEAIMPVTNFFGGD